MVGTRISGIGAGAASIATGVSGSGSGVAVAGTVGEGGAEGGRVAVDTWAAIEVGGALTHPANHNITKIKAKRQYQSLSLFIFIFFNPQLSVIQSLSLNMYTSQALLYYSCGKNRFQLGGLKKTSSFWLLVIFPSLLLGVFSSLSLQLDGETRFLV